VSLAEGLRGNCEWILRQRGQIGFLTDLERAHTIVAEGDAGAAACIGGERQPRLRAARALWDAFPLYLTDLAICGPSWESTT
jgi:hypothetical protein